MPQPRSCVRSSEGRHQSLARSVRPSVGAPALVGPTLCLLLSCLLLGCSAVGASTDVAQASKDEAGGGAAIRFADPVPVPATSYALGRSVEQRRIEAFVLGEGPEVVMFLATIHGDEAAGTPLLERLAAELMMHPDPLEGRRAVIVPVVNPDGFAANRRGNANGVDLNRNFSTDDQGDARRGGEHPLSEPEAAALAALIEFHDPARVVSIHQPVGCVDYDGPAEALAQAVGAACNLPVHKLGGRPGSLGSWLGVARGVPIITLELPRRVESDPDALWGRYGPALHAVLTFDGTSY